MRAIVVTAKLIETGKTISATFDRYNPACREVFAATGADAIKGRALASAMQAFVSGGHRIDGDTIGVHAID